MRLVLSNDELLGPGLETYKLYCPPTVNRQSPKIFLIEVPYFLLCSHYSCLMSPVLNRQCSNRVLRAPQGNI